MVAKAVASSGAWKPAREFRRRPLSQEECAQQRAGLGPPADSSRFKVSQVQGHLLPSQTCWFSAQGSGRGVGVVQSHQWASALQPNREGGPWLDL